MEFVQESEYIYHVFDLLKEQVQKHNIPNYYTNNTIGTMHYTTIKNIPGSE